MKVLRRIAAVLTCVAFLGGCFQVETRVRVNPDGSGTVEERMLMSDKVIRQLDEMSRAFAGPEGKAAPFNLHDQKELRSRAETMGEGVKYVSSDDISSDGYTGYRAVYSFRDINKLRLSQETTKPGAGGAGEQGKTGGKPFLFQFTPGKAARLVVIPPPEKAAERKTATEGDEKPAAGGEGPKQAPTPEQEKEMAEIMKGLRFSLVLEVNGKVISSNATHREGGRITVFEFDLARFGNDPEKLRLLKTADPADYAGARELMKAFPGIKADLNERIEVVFTR